MLTSIKFRKNHFWRKMFTKIVENLQHSNSYIVTYTKPENIAIKYVNFNGNLLSLYKSRFLFDYTMYPDVSFRFSSHADLQYLYKETYFIWMKIPP